jgi:ABC-type transport system involved in multi-copper enzyme maturation permease subunit
MLRSLIWKEWHEQRWKLAFACVILLSYTGIGVYTRILPDAAILLGGTVCAAILLPIFACMDLVAAERAEGSLKTLLVLPVRHWAAFAVKAAIGLLTCVAPLFANLLLFLALTNTREASNAQLVPWCVGMMAFSASAFVWMFAFGMRQPSEARAALVSIGVLFAWIFALSNEMFWSRAHTHLVSATITPMGWFFAQAEDAENLLPRVAGFQFGICLLLLWWAAVRFSRLSRTHS